LKKKKLVKHPKPSQQWWSRSPDPAAWQLHRANILTVDTIFVMDWLRVLSKVFGQICKLAE
jgi:hypothetical protein